MKHPIHRHHRRQGTEWISAIFTLLVLVGIYSSTDNFDSYSALLASPSGSTQKKLTVANPYWNNTLAYWFRSVEWDTYSSTESEKSDTVTVTESPTRKVSADGKVRVTFYPDTPIDVIDATLPKGMPRAYSRLSNGIAVIEWDLDSPSAKTILSTLHPR